MKQIFSHFSITFVTATPLSGSSVEDGVNNVPAAGRGSSTAGFVYTCNRSPISETTL